MPETMPEATRRQYLALLGIEQWLPRADADPVEQHAQAETDVPASATALSVEQRAAQLDALLGRHGPQSGAAQAAPVSPAQAPVVAEKTPEQTAPQAAQQVVGRIGCTFLSAGDGLLLIASFATPSAPGLSSAEHEMLARLAAALLPGRSLPSPKDFSWPPAGVRVPGMDAPGAAREALRGLLDEQRRRGVRDIAVLGDELGAVIAELAGNMGLPLPVRVPALAVMLLEPQRKRDCWIALGPLRREPLA